MEKFSLRPKDQSSPAKHERGLFESVRETPPIRLLDWKPFGQKGGLKQDQIKIVCDVVGSIWSAPEGVEMVDKALEYEMSRVEQGLIRNGILCTLPKRSQGFSVRGDANRQILSMQIGFCRYAEAMAVDNNPALDLGSKLQYGTGALVLSALVRTADGKLVVVRRAPKSTQGANAWGLVGGAYNLDELSGGQAASFGNLDNLYREIQNGQFDLGQIPDPFEMISLEVAEELGLSVDFENISMVDVLVDGLGRPVIYFAVQTELNSGELQKCFQAAGNKAEHTEILLVDKLNTALISQLGQVTNTLKTGVHVRI